MWDTQLVLILKDAGLPIRKIKIIFTKYSTSRINALCNQHGLVTELSKYGYRTVQYYPNTDFTKNSVVKVKQTNLKKQIVIADKTYKQILFDDTVRNPVGKTYKQILLEAAARNPQDAYLKCLAKKRGGITI